ncbi:hypothetical protein QN416_26990, partial [Glaciimonas sp. Cout2]|uniref:hypothetical protein n=1 Tax=Glaciimonas sp. Cout2 TaxID=3048621 RepID=UPI002B239C2A
YIRLRCHLCLLVAFKYCLRLLAHGLPLAVVRAASVCASDRAGTPDRRAHVHSREYYELPR